MWCIVAEECVNSSLDMGRGEGLEEDGEVKRGSTENKRWQRQEVIHGNMKGIGRKWAEKCIEVPHKLETRTN